MAEKRKSRWRRWLKWPLIGFGILLILVYVVLPLIVTPMIRNRLQKQLSIHLNADLQMGRVYYWFPYGVTVSDAVLVARDQQGEAIQLLKIDRLKLALAKLPFGEGPLVIRKLILVRPEIHLMNTNEGLVGRQTLVKAEPSPGVQSSAPALVTNDSTGPAPATAPAVQAQRKPKLSEMLELRLVRIEDAQIIYEDRKSPQTVPAAWRNIRIDLATTPQTNPVYEFDITASNGELAEMRVAGSMNIDELEVSLKKVTARVNLAAQTAESAVPAALQRLLLNNHVRGDFDISGSAFLPLRRMEEAGFDLRVNLKGGATRAGKLHSDGDADDSTFDKITAKLRWSTEPLTDEQAFLATAGMMRAEKDATAASPAADAGKRKKVPAAYLLVEEAEVFMGDNRLEIKNAGLAYDLRLKEWEARQVHGTLSLGASKGQLPKPLRAAFEKPQFFGVVELVLDGRGSLIKPADGSRRPYQVTLKASCPELIMTSRRLVATNVVCNMRMTPGLIQFVDGDPQNRAISANLYGGSLNAFGAIRTGAPAHFDFAGRIDNVNLRAFASDWSSTENASSKASGRAFANLQLGWTNGHGGKRTIDLLTSDGTFEILDGEFYEMPVLAQIAGAITLNKNAGKVGQAAARFRIAEREIHFKPVAVSAPMLGLRGDGKMSFDGELDFKAVAAPLADWKEQMQKTRIPIFDSVGAELVGGFQKILDSTTGKLLYQFRVTGNRSKPVVTPMPAPILTEDGVNLLKNMMKGTGKLLDSI